jgi:VacB/RNase II family 3'-5' exoribonuclease
MRVANTVTAILADGFARIRAEFDVPGPFSEEVESAARTAAVRDLGGEHRDRTSIPFVTLDPATSTDLDQAFWIERRGPDLVLLYAIADVAWFVRPGDPVDAESWRRGVTIYLPDGRVPLHPTVLSEGAASLLPDGDRPAIVFEVHVADDGEASLQGVERARVRSRAKLAYETVRADQLPAELSELAGRVAAAEQARGAFRVDAPEQEVVAGDDGGWVLRFRPRRDVENCNSALSLATNLAVAQALIAARTGLFRVMPAPSDQQVRRLRLTARALGLEWPENVSLADYQRSLDGLAGPPQAFLNAVRRASGKASYAPWQPGIVPWHAAMAGSYVHATAPLRRLADRFVVGAAWAIAAGGHVDADVAEAFTRLPAAMDEAEARAARVDAAARDLVETALLHGSEGQTFDAVVTDVDEAGARIQLSEPAVVARVRANGLEPGRAVRARLVGTDVVHRTVRFELVTA